MLVLLLPLATPPPARAGDVGDVVGLCARCHEEPAALEVTAGGHSSLLDCQSCHAQRKPHRFGRRHRRVPRCTSCHADAVGHPPRKRNRRKTNKNCLRCHAPHGSPNLDLVRTGIRRFRRIAPVTFVTMAGDAPGGYADPAAPGTGLCELCHRDTAYYPRSGDGEPHFTESCTLCHMHDVAFDPVAAEQNCRICHTEQAARFEIPSGHSRRLECTSCHQNTDLPIGPGHETIRACADCHDTATHAPGGQGFPCESCHDPHGSTNTYLVDEEILTPQGALRPILFDNLQGRADGSFASASDPGSGICEVCHTTTRYYTAGGDGAPHFTVSCLPCHRHSAGFAPR